jgi:hypothetical protein
MVNTITMEQIWAISWLELFSDWTFEPALVIDKEKLTALRVSRRDSDLELL